MSTTITQTVEQQVPAGTYRADESHSSAAFEVEHAGISTFRGGFKPIDARLESGPDGLRLEGAVRVDSISVDDENIRPHLLAPDFFDVERNPEVRFRSTRISGSPDALSVAGELSLAGFSLPVEATGRLRGPLELPGGGRKVALALEAVIDRTAYGMNWQMELPGGTPALANEVKLVVDIEFNGE